VDYDHVAHEQSLAETLLDVADENAFLEKAVNDQRSLQDQVVKMEKEKAVMESRLLVVTRQKAFLEKQVTSREQDVDTLRQIDSTQALASARHSPQVDRQSTEGGEPEEAPGDGGGVSLDLPPVSSVLLVSPEGDDIAALQEALDGQPDVPPDVADEEPSDALNPSDQLLVSMGESLKALVLESNVTQGGLTAQVQMSSEQQAMMMTAFTEMLQNAKGLNAGVSDMLQRLVLKTDGAEGESHYSKPSGIDRLRDPSSAEIDILVTSLPMGETKKWVKEFIYFLCLKHIDLDAIFRKNWKEVDSEDKLADAYVARSFLLCLVRTSTRVRSFLMQVDHAREAGAPTSSGLWLLTAAMQFAEPKNETHFKILRAKFEATPYFQIGMAEEDFMLNTWKLVEDYCVTPRVVSPAYLFYAVLSKVPTSDLNCNRFLHDMHEHLNNVQGGYTDLMSYDYFLSQLCFKVCLGGAHENSANGLFALSAEADDADIDPGDNYDHCTTDDQAIALWASKGKASMPSVRTGDRSKGSRTPNEPPQTKGVKGETRNCWDCARLVPAAHPFGNKNCDRKCGWDKPGCGHGFCPGNQGLPCIVRQTAKFKFPDVLNGAGRPLPKRLVDVLLESQVDWHKTTKQANVAMVAQYYGVDMVEAEATLAGESGNDF